MNCDEFVELVTAFLDGALDAEAEARLVDHLSECDGCTVYLDQFRQTIESLAELPADGLPSEARAALLAAFEERSA